MTASPRRKPPVAGARHAADLPDPGCSLGLTAGQQRALDHELCYLLHRQPAPVTVTKLFDGFRPAWAVEAVERCVARGLVVARKVKLNPDDERPKTVYAVTVLGLVLVYETPFVNDRGHRYLLEPNF